ncbi:MAG: hypothetical protein ACJAZO_002008 [Myxococcota bacterium]
MAGNLTEKSDNTKVEDVNAVFGIDEDIRRLYITVDDAALV